MRAKTCNLRLHEIRHEVTSKFLEKRRNVMEVAVITDSLALRALQVVRNSEQENLAKKLG